ncbi:hypothetical protein N0V83_005360 [Neocucurbitaria cava]|uniref:Uncharacterized protein n=1 Tax=Neocucurbitaria cava TaxID=798079 RepID=A0A9W8Y6L8_9PLEO|nr:hypothetical protein N0V83_005360 [Neocucurbitaria cava]
MKLSTTTLIAAIVSSSPPPALAFDSSDLADPQDWTRYTLKGGALLCALHATDQLAGRQLHDTRNPPSAASIWTGDLKQALETWYWHDVPPTEPSICDIAGYWKIPFAVRSLGLDSRLKVEGGDNACYRVEHWDPGMKDGENGRQVPAINQWYNVDGREYRSTGAHYEFATNPRGGALYTFYLESPKSSASSLWYNSRKDASPDDLPSLRALSDVLWGFWNRENENVKNIRYFFVLGVTNEVTNQLIATCLQNAGGKELSDWPGTSFGTGTEEGHALLGSPNGATFAYFLLQHKAQLGYKSISKVTVFPPETDDDVAFVDPALVFHVEDVTDLLHDEAEEEVKKDAGDRRAGTVLRIHKLHNSNWM